MKRTLVAVLAVLALAGVQPRADMPPAAKASLHVPTMTQFMGFSFPMELVAAKKVDRIAWIANDKGMRNVFTAAAPDFKPVRVTSYLKDDGVDTTQLSISDDGTTVSFTRGHETNQNDWVASPDADPNGVERAIWAAKTTTPGLSWRLSEGSNGVLSPDGRFVAYAKNGDIFRVPTAQGARVNDFDKGVKPYVRIWGVNSNPVWSPDGKKLAFVSRRTDHSFIAVYDVASRKVSYISPSVDFDTSPAWSADSKSMAYIRRPGTPFAQQSQNGVGGLGNPAGPAFNAANAGRGGGGGGRGGGGGGQGRGGRGDAAAAPGAAQATPPAPRPGLTTATFAGGYNLAFWVADASTGDAQEFWHNAPDDKVFNGITAITWRGGHVVFQLEPEEWTRFYSVAVPTPGGMLHNTGPNNHTDVFGPVTSAPPAAAPISLTPQDGQIESSGFSTDGRFLYYGTNATDIERRHLWRVPVAGGEPVQLTKGQAIEHDPVALPSGKYIAALTADYNRPQSVGIFSLSQTESEPARRSLGEGGAQKVIYPILPKSFPTDAHVVPQIVMTKAADGTEVHNQLFLPEGSASRREAPGDHLRARRPGAADDARVPLHGGLPPLLRREPVAREPGLHRDVGELPRRHRLRQVVPHRAQHQRARQLRVPGRAGGRQVPAVAS